METANPSPSPNQQAKSSSSSSSHVDDAIESSRREEMWRNWAELGQDALSLIFEKAGFVDVLLGAQYVCRTWRRVSFDPSLWRLIHVAAADEYFEGIVMEAINRAQGHVQCFSPSFYGSDVLLSYLADRNRNLRCLRLIPQHELSCEGVAKAVGRLPLLEELDITSPEDNTLIKLVGEACPHLKCFRYNDQGSRDKDVQNDEEAFGIANYMPELRQLQIVGNMLTNKGLLAILDKCLHLESLDLRRCFHVDLNASVLAKCTRIVNLRRPNEATDDCEFIHESEDDFSDDDSEDDFSDDEDTFLQNMSYNDLVDYMRDDFYDSLL